MSKNKSVARGNRQRRLRKKVTGTSSRPRLSVFRSSSHISAQVIDDESGKTIASASTYESSLRGKGHSGNVEAAQTIGKILGERATAAGVKTVVFDRGGNRYHGRVAALADAAREQGLEF